MKKHTKLALIVASCLSIGATFLMIHPSQAFFLDLPQQKKRHPAGYRQTNESAGKRCPRYPDYQRRNA